MTPSRRVEVVVLAVFAGLAPLVGLLAPLGLAALVPLAGACCLPWAWRNGFWRDFRAAVPAVIALTVLWGALGAIWAVDPLHSLRTAAAFAAMATTGLAIRSVFRTLDRRGTKAVAMAMLAGVVIAVALVVADVSSCGTVIARPFRGVADLCGGGRFVYKRGLTVLVVFCLPLLAMVARIWSGRRALALAAGLFFVFGWLCWWIDAHTLFVGTAAGAAVFAAVHLMDRRALAAMGVVLALAVVAAPLAARQIPAPGTWLDVEMRMPPSLHHRLTIWRFAAERLSERPLLGWGMDAARAISGGEDRFQLTAYDGDQRRHYFDEPFLPLHPHNAILQWWLELGVVGGLLLVALGAAVLTGLSRRPHRTDRAFGAAALATIVIVALASFGAWQSWWVATMWLTGALLALPRSACPQEARLKILFLTENFPPETNAAATRVYERALYWAKGGHEVTVITCFPNFPLGKVFEGYSNDWYKVEEMDGLRVVRVKTFISANEGFAKRTLDFLSFMVTGVAAGLIQSKPDVVVATSPQFFAAVGGWMLGVLRGVPFVFELGDLWPRSILAVGAMRQSFAIRMLEKLELFLYRRSACVVALTHAFKDDLVRRHIDPDKIAVVINGVDLPRYEPRPRDEDLAHDWGLTGKFVVGYVGTHGMAHGLINVLDAAERMKGDDRLRFLLVGAGAERQMLIDEAARRGLANVVFQPLQPKAMMPRIWSLCDVALVHLKDDPAFAEVIPSKIFEAMGMGLPLLLVSPEGEASRIVLDDAAGLWVPAGRPQELAEAVVRLARDDGERATLAAHSLASAPLHSRERQASQMIAVLEAVVRGEGAHAARFAV